MKKIIWASLFITLELTSFSTLKRAEEYAKKRVEYPDSDNQDWTDPDYTNFIKSNKPGFFKKILNYFKKEQEYWSPKDFNKNIAELTKKNKDSEKTIYLEISDNEKFIIFGALGGAYHSLVRDLNELERKHIINNKLEIIEKHTYIIFVGNAVGTSPYNMETLFLITNLIQKNNGKVIYLEGPQEYREYWADKTFGKELAIKGVMPSNKKDSLKNLMKDYFLTLPNAIVLNLPKSKESIIISFLTNPDEKIFLKNEKKLSPKYPVKLEFHSDSPRKDFPEGGAFLISDKDKKILQIVSSPTRSNRYLYSILNDNFAILDIKDGKYNLLQICGEDSYFKKNFVCQEASKMQEIKKNEKISEEKISKKEETKQAYAPSSGKILFGSTMDITKSNNIIAIPVKQGLSVKLNKQNSSGGIDNKLIQIIFLDDQYTPQLARKNIEKLINEDKTNLIIAPVGSPTLAASLDLIKDKKILVLFSNSGSPLFRAPELTNIVHFRVSYVDEAKALIAYMQQKFSPKRIAFFYQNDEYGIPPVEYSAKRLTEMGVDENNILKIPYSRNDINIQVAMKKIIEFGPDAIGFYALPFVGGELIRQMGPGRLANIKMFGLSPMGEEGFRNLLKTNGLKMIISNVVPSPDSSKLEIIKDYQNDTKSQGILNYSNIYMLEGYIDMCLTIEILKRISTTTIDAESIMKSAESIKNLEFKGLTLNFNPENNQLNDKLWLDTGDPEWIEIKTS